MNSHMTDVHNSYHAVVEEVMFRQSSSILPLLIIANYNAKSFQNVLMLIIMVSHVGHWLTQYRCIYQYSCITI